MTALDARSLDRRARDRPGSARRARRPPRPGDARGQPVPRDQPAAQPPARVRRPGRRAGAGRRGSHGARGPRGALPARLLHPARRPAASRSSTRPSGCATAARSPPGGCWRSSTAYRSSPCRRRSSSPQTGLEHTRARARRACPRRTRCPSSTRSPRRRARGGSPRARGRSTCASSSAPPWSDEFAGATEEPARVWMRADGRLPDDRLLHVCMLTYVSDLTLLGSVLVRHDRAEGPVQMASLDHAMWFHRPFRADEWLLYTCYSPMRGRRAGPGAPAASPRPTARWWPPPCRRAWSGFGDDSGPCRWRPS